MFNPQLCLLYVGMSGYKQKLSLGTLCWTHAIATHEIGKHLIYYDQC